MTLTLDHRAKVLIVVVLMLALAGGGWLLGIQPALAAAFSAVEQESGVRLQNDAARAQLGRLAAADKNLPALRTQLGGLDASIPGTTDTAALITGINAIAAASGVTVDRIAVDISTPYSAPGEKPAAGTPAAGTPAAGTLAADKSVLPTTDPRITAANFVVVPVSVDVAGALDGALAFVGGVQSGPRLFLVNRVATVSDAAAGGHGTAVKTTVSGYVYVLLPQKGAPVPAA